MLITKNALSQNKTIVPEYGAIVFSCADTIYDKNLYQNSLINLIPKLKEEMKNELLSEGIVLISSSDSLLFEKEIEKAANNFVYMMSSSKKEDVKNKKICLEFNKEIITKYHIINEIPVSKITINTVTGEALNDIGKNITLHKSQIISLEEYKDETKTINGYKCYKVVYRFIEPENFLNFLANTREIWVTETIKCKYHPLINDVEILKKYYPLEIVEYTDELKGMLTSYKVQVMSFDN